MVSGWVTFITGSIRETRLTVLLQDREWYKHKGTAPGIWLGYGATTFPALTEGESLVLFSSMDEHLGLTPHQRSPSPSRPLSRKRRRAS